MPLLTNTGYPVQQGEPFTLVFEGCNFGCTVILQRDDADELEDVKTLTKNAIDHNFTFTLNGLPTGTYDFKVVDNNDGSVDYSSQFELEGSNSQTTETSVASESSISSAIISSSESLLAPTTASSFETSTSPSLPVTSSGSSSSSQNALKQTSSDDGSTASIASAVSTSSIPPTQSSSGSNHGFSSGALAGIVVGVIAVVILVLAGAFLWWRKRKQNRGSNPVLDADEQNNQISELEQPKKGMQASPTSPFETHGSTVSPPVAELAGRVRSAELPNTELDNKRELEAEPVVFASELHGENKPTHSELHAETAKYEMDSNQQPEQPPPTVQNPVQQPPKNYTPSPSLSTVSPDTGVSIMPHGLGEALSPSIVDTTSLPYFSSNEDTPQSHSALMDQYTQLEARRQRILELQRIEEEQAELQKRLRRLPDNSGR